MSDWWQFALVGGLILIFLYLAVSTWFDKSINSRGTTRNRGLSGERGDEYRDRSAL